MVNELTAMLKKLQTTGLRIYPVLKHIKTEATHSVSNWSLQGSVLFLLAADMVEGEKQVVVIS